MAIEGNMGALQYSFRASNYLRFLLSTKRTLAFQLCLLIDLQSMMNAFLTNEMSN